MRSKAVSEDQWLPPRCGGGEGVNHQTLHNHRTSLQGCRELSCMRDRCCDHEARPAGKTHVNLTVENRRQLRPLVCGTSKARARRRRIPAVCMYPAGCASSGCRRGEDDHKQPPRGRPARPAESATESIAAAHTRLTACRLRLSIRSMNGIGCRCRMTSRGEWSKA